MFVSMNWIRDYVNLDGLDIENLIHRFTLATAEVEDIIYKGKDLKDIVVGRRELTYAKTMTVDGLRCVYTFHGGSTFVRKEIFPCPLFMNIMYGNEELAVSMSALDRGFRCVYMPEIYMEHRPMVNKWMGGDKERLYMQGISNIYAIKRLIYPTAVTPLLYAAYKKRMKKNALTDKALIREFSEKRKAFSKAHKVKKIRLSTVVKAYREFGLTVF